MDPQFKFISRNRAISTRDSLTKCLYNSLSWCRPAQFLGKSPARSCEHKNHFQSAGRPEGWCLVSPTMVKSALPIVAFAFLAVTLASANNSYTPIGGTCGGYYKPCVSGTTCKSGKCTQEGIEAGLACGVCKICKAGLDCKDGKCTAPPPPPSACGESCAAPGATCVSSLTCEKGTCQQLGVDAGLVCSACKICKTGLDCKGGKCTAPPPPPSACGESCAAPGATCVSGLTCEKGTCQQLGVDAGLACSACKICKNGLDCKDGKCAAKQVIAKCCEKCGTGPSDAKCESGTYCVNGTCIKSVGAGSKCSACQVCSKGLTCNGNSHTCVGAYRHY
jgi:hypothetical protein